MAITSNPLMSTTAASPAPGTANPLTLQAIQTPSVNPSTLTQNPSGVINTLASNAPQSLTSLLMPLYQQLFGQQTGALASQNALTTQGNVAQAQSSAQQRGLTGSSIEAGAMQGATAAGQQSYENAYSSLLGQYVGTYANAASSDVANQQTYYGNLASALGQAYSTNVQQTEFNNQLAATSAAAGKSANSTLYAGLAGGAGAALAGIFSDMRLKKNVVKLGRRFGLDVVGFEYDRARAPQLALPGGKFVGFLAHQVADKYPKAVRVDRGYLKIDMVKLQEAVLA